MKRILITTGNGMFGRALIEHLKTKDVLMRIMVRDRSRMTFSDPRAEIVTGDMDKPETLEPLMEGVDGVFLSTPMDDRLAEREKAVIRAAKQKGVGQIVKIAGAVKHEGDELAQMHEESMDFLRSSGIPLTLVSPSSLMETSFLSYAPSVRYMHAIYGMSGHGKIGLVALKDVAEVSAHVLTTPGHDGLNYELTGPESIDLYEVAARFTRVLGTRIRYIDLSEEKFTKMMVKFDKSMTPEKLEIEVLCHLRAWREGRADLVTGTFRELTGREPAPVDEFIHDNLDLFKKGMVPSFMASLMRLGVPG
jgi:NAD(P)H dehydrogenase (quinone)